MKAERYAVVLDEARIDDIFRAFEGSRQPGAAVAIAVDGRPVYRKAFGLASLELPAALQPTTRIRIGSTTKYFTCFLFLLLCREGRADIDDPLTRYFPGFAGFAEGVTVRHLMSNTSGLRDAFHVVSALRGHLDGHRGRHPTSHAELLNLYEQMGDVEAAPGATWMYNNGGFLLLGLSIEKILGVPLDDAFRQKLFAPLGMHDTGLKPSDRDFTPNTATCHHPSGAGFVRAEFGYDYGGGGGLVSTADDMLRWFAAIEEGRIGDAQLHAAMRARQPLANGRLANYGFGLFVQTYRGLDIFSHGGSWVGTSTQMLYAPSAGLSVAIFANRGDQSATILGERIIDACVTGLDTVASRPVPELLAGIFRSPSSGRVVRLAGAGSEARLIVDGLAMPVMLDESGMLRPAVPLDHIQLGINLGEGGVATERLVIDDFGTIDTLERLTPPASDDLARFAGHFRSERLGCELDIVRDEGGLHAQTISRFGSMDFVLVRVGESVFEAKPLDFIDAILVFDANSERVEFRNFFTRALEFVRS